MTVKQYFTIRGVWGVALFLLSPILSGAFYVGWATQDSYNISIIPLVLSGIFSFLTLASIPMMLVGREYEVEKPR